MALIVIDHGNRIKTPVRSLFPARGVDSTTQAKATHDSAGLEKQVHADGEPFSHFLGTDASNPHNEAQPDTYSPTKPDQRLAHHKRLKAAQIMTHPVHTISREATFKTVWSRMQELHISHLMVTDAQEHPVGIISRTDIIEHGKDSPVSIANFFTKQLIAALPDTDVAVISATFIEYEINAIPVFNENEQLLGIVCRSDLLRLLISGAHIEGWA